jgi:hypothetical protein
MLSQLIHDPESYVAKTLDQAIQKLAKLNEYYNAVSRWGQNIYLASKDLEEKYQEDFIRYLGNPASFDPANTGAAIESAVAAKIPANGRNEVDPNYVQTYTLVHNKNGRDFDVLVTNGEKPEPDDEKHPEPEPTADEIEEKFQTMAVSNHHC